MASDSEMMISCAVWPIVRVMSGQIGFSVMRDLPSFCVKMASTQ